MFKSIGTLRYFGDPYKLIVEIDPEISKYYQSLIPPYILYNKQRYEPHISVIRKEIIPNLQLWGKYEGQDFEFEYDNFIYMSKNYLWLNVFSGDLEIIRLELGLTKTSETTRSPDGRHKFHTTIGNFKNNDRLDIR
jgi:hypothetical protein